MNGFDYIECFVNIFKMINFLFNFVWVWLWICIVVKNKKIFIKIKKERRKEKSLVWGCVFNLYVYEINN